MLDTVARVRSSATASGRDVSKTTRGFFRACIYVVVNPVAAGLCAQPGDWPWSSYAATADGPPDDYRAGEQCLLEMFGETPAEARRRYVEVLDQATELVRERRRAGGKSLWRALAPLEAHVRRVEERVSG